jgi:hypothetical protein
MLPPAAIGVTVAYGQGEGADNQLNNCLMSNGTGLVVMPTRQVARRIVVDPAMSTSLVSSGAAMSAGTILLKEDDTVYIMRDRRTPTRKMFCETLIHGPG